MTTIDDIFENQIIESLKNITVENGYMNNVSVLDGYMVHYVNDLLNEKDGLSFPCVAAQPVNEIVESSKAGVKAKITRVIKIIGAVSVSKRNLVNRNINSLVSDTRKALHLDKFNNNSKATEIVIGNVEFNLPDNASQYAFFETTINVTYMEYWDK